jgi:hypothetical protein
MGNSSSSLPNTHSDMEKKSLKTVPMEQLIGMTVEEANDFLGRHVIPTNGQRFEYVRIVRKDGIDQQIDNEIREERLDVFIVNDTITGFDTFI